MNIIQTFKMSIKSIWHNKTRSLLTMLGIIIGVASVITLVSVMQGAQKQIMDSYNSMGTNRIDVYYSSWQNDLTDELYAFCKTLDEYVDGITPNAGASVQARYKTKNIEMRLRYGSADYDLCNNWTLKNGRTISYADIKNRVRVCTIGSYIADSFFGLENPVGKQIKINGYNFTVIGVYESKYPDTSTDMQQYTDDNQIVVPYTLNRTISGTTTIDQFVIKGKDGESVTAAIEEIKAFLKPHFKNEWDYSVYSSNEWQDAIAESNTMMTLLVAGIASISLLVGGIGIMNIMLVSVTERTREIGIRMAIGAKQSNITWQFLIEAAAVSAFGGVIGIIIGGIGSVVLSAAILKEVYLPSIPTAIIAFTFSAILGMFFGYYPARKAAKMPPVEALRNN